MTLLFLNADPAHTNFQYLEDLSTAYWFSETLFAAMELHIFDVIEKKFPTTHELAGAASCHEDELDRMLTVLNRMELITTVDGRWVNSQISRTYLTSESSSYMGNFLLYRKYMQSGWRSLTQKISNTLPQKLSLRQNQTTLKKRLIMYKPWTNYRDRRQKKFCE